MSEINVNRDSKLIKVLAAQVNNQRVDSDKVEEASQIITELASDLSPQKMHQIGQIVAYTVDELQSKSLDFLNLVADIKNIGYGDKAAFKVRTGGIKAVIQAKGATAPRSYIADSQILVDTKEIAARPAINVVDLRTGRVQMSELIRQANVAITNKKIAMVESVLHDSIDNFSTPFYAASGNTTLVAATLDAQINYFRRLGPVTLLGDMAAVGQLAGHTGMAVSTTGVQFSGDLINENNNNGYIGRYRGCDVIAMTNAYEEGSTTPILATDWIYIIPGGQSAEMRNLKIVNEGPVNSMASQNIDDRTYEILLDQWFGVAFVVGKLPTSGAHFIG